MWKCGDKYGLVKMTEFQLDFSSLLTLPMVSSLLCVPDTLVIEIYCDVITESYSQVILMLFLLHIN